MMMVPFLDDFERSLLPRRRAYSRGWLSPLTPSTDVFDRVVDNAMRELHELERQLGDVSTDEGNFNWQCNVNGYRPDELKVDLEGDQLVVRGEHRDAREGETVFRSFERRMTLPEGARKEAIRCDLDNRGRLNITAPVPQPEGQRPQRQSIPIGFKQAGPEQQKIEHQKQDIDVGKKQEAAR
ncbi:small HSP21-like protein [Aphelenchoides avenae]|nr:small HSP21-like protein [Aphelenchus avenae]